MSDKQLLMSVVACAENITRDAQKCIVNALVIRYGGVRKAANAVGMAAGNFANIKSGKRRLTLKSLRELVEKFEDTPTDAKERG